MNNLKFLFDSKDYLSILEKTKDNDTIDFLLYRLNAFIALKKFSEALDLIDKYNDKFFNNNPINCMEIHFGLLSELNKVDSAITVMNNYQNKNYVSQKVEEYLRELPAKIFSLIKKNNKNEQRLSADEILKILNDDNDETKIYAAINQLKEYEILPFITSIKKLLIREDISDELKSVTLFLLIEKKLKQKINLKKSVLPSAEINICELTIPYENKDYIECFRDIQKFAKDPSIESVAINLLQQYTLIIFPYNIFAKYSFDLVAKSLIILACEYLKVNLNIDKYYQNILQSSAMVSKILNELKIVLNKEK